MSYFLQVKKDNIVNVYSLKYYGLKYIKNSDTYELYVKYNDEKGVLKFKKIDHLHEKDFSFISNKDNYIKL